MKHLRSVVFGFVIILGFAGCPACATDTRVVPRVCEVDSDCPVNECAVGMFAICTGSAEDQGCGCVSCRSHTDCSCDDNVPVCIAGSCSCKPAECEDDADCDDADECTSDTCDSENAACVHSAVADGTTCTGGVPGCGALITSLGDGDFAKGTWDDGVVVTGRSANYEPPVVTDPTSGGNPGAHRRVEMTVSSTVDEGGVIWVAHGLGAAVYDPADGAVCGIRMFLDGTDEFTGGQAIFSTFLFQDDTYYWGERLFVNEDAWTTGEWPIDDSGYQKFFGLGPDLPDLSTRGGTIRFGFLTGASRPAGTVGTGSTTYGADNFRVELYAPLSE